jgi:hypothetical protein
VAGLRVLLTAAGVAATLVAVVVVHLSGDGHPRPAAAASGASTHRAAAPDRSSATPSDRGEAALRTAAIRNAMGFAAQWWGYDASRARPGHANDVLHRAARYLDARASAQLAELVPTAQVWAQLVADRQRSAPFDLAGYVPGLWAEAIAGPDAALVAAGTVMVTVTGDVRISWVGGSYTDRGLELTVAVVCATLGAPAASISCAVDYLFPRVGR